MLQRVIDPDVPEDNPFVNDLLDRKTIAENLTTLIENTTTPYVMSISAPWGEGKTTFARMWRQHLKNNGFAVISFDAWSSDYANDPLLSFIGSIDASIEKTNSPARNAMNAVKDTLKKIVKASPKIAMNWALRGGLHYVTDGEEKAKDEVQALSEIGAKLIEEEMDQYVCIKELLSDFGEKLSTLGDTLGDEGKPLVILIDELDRARPDYAIELLERIKHLFAVPNLLIVLSVDIEKLGQAASKVIGFASDHSQGYLRRFIDLDYRLPQPSLQNLIAANLNRVEIPSGFVWRDLDKWLASYARLNRLSSRDCLQILSRFAATAKSFPDIPDPMKQFMPFLVLDSYVNHQSTQDFMTSSEHARAKMRGIRLWRDEIIEEKNYNEYGSRNYIFRCYAAWLRDLATEDLSEEEKEDAMNWIRFEIHLTSLPRMRERIMDAISYAEAFR